MNLTRFALDVFLSAIRTGACRCQAGATVVRGALALAYPRYAWRVMPLDGALGIVRIEEGHEGPLRAAKTREDFEEVTR